MCKGPYSCFNQDSSLYFSGVWGFTRRFHKKTRFNSLLNLHIKRTVYLKLIKLTYTYSVYTETQQWKHNTSAWIQEDINGKYIII